MGGGEDATVLGATDDMKGVGDDGAGLADIVLDDEDDENNRQENVSDYVIKDAKMPALKYKFYYILQG